MEALPKVLEIELLICYNILLRSRLKTQAYPRYDEDF